MKLTVLDRNFCPWYHIRGFASRRQRFIPEVIVSGRSFYFFYQWSSLNFNGSFFIILIKHDLTHSDSLNQVFGNIPYFFPFIREIKEERVNFLGFKFVDLIEARIDNIVIVALYFLSVKFSVVNIFHFKAFRPH